MLSFVDTDEVDNFYSTKLDSDDDGGSTFQVPSTTLLLSLTRIMNGMVGAEVL